MVRTRTIRYTLGGGNPVSPLQSLFNTKGRIAVDIAMVQQRLMTAVNCVLYPLDEQVARRIPPGLNIHDAIIPTATLECIAKICPCKMAVLQGPATRGMRV